MLLEVADHDILDPPFLLVRPSPINGRGVFVTRPFRADDRLYIIAGDVIAADEARRREREEANWYIYCHPAGQCIDTARAGYGRFINHSCLPNTATVARDPSTLYLIALTEIAAGSELTLDYDYPEIYDLCRLSPDCLQAACPHFAPHNIFEGVTL
jgi:hypothetical protein